MSEKDKILLEIWKSFEDNDLIIGSRHLDILTNALFNLTQSLYDNKEEIEYYQRELEGKLFRFGLANQSIINLTRGNDFLLVNQNARITDMFSLKVIARMQIESFIMMFYLFFDNVSIEELNFRYYVYKIHGLRKQKEFIINNNSSFSINQEKKIDQELNDAIESLKKSSIYSNLSQKEKDKAINPYYAKRLKSEILFERSGLNNTRLRDIWKINSNYAHAEHISDRQYNSAFKNDKTFIQRSCFYVLTMSFILTSKLIDLFVPQFKSTEKMYEEFSNDKKLLIDTWKDLKTIDKHLPTQK